MEWWDTLLEGLGYYSLVGVVWFLCAAGLILSVLSISGTCLVLLASLILMSRLPPTRAARNRPAWTSR